jgi:diguanylate cyclase (GGDEF)-like protein
MDANDPLPRAERRKAFLDALGLGKAVQDARTRAAFEALCEEIIELRSNQFELQARLQDAEELADHDALCPVFNRRAFEREVRREIAHAGRFETPLSLIFIDLDRFKLVNDIFGHIAGDEVLLRVSEILIRNIRETDIVGRLGGDEFGVVLSQASERDARRKADHLATLIDAIIVRDANAGGRSVRIGGSCGVVEWRSGETAGDLIARADQDMFANKAARRTGEAETPNSRASHR